MKPELTKASTVDRLMEQIRNKEAVEILARVPGDNGEVFIVYLNSECEAGDLFCCEDKGDKFLKECYVIAKYQTKKERKLYGNAGTI